MLLFWFATLFLTGNLLAAWFALPLGAWLGLAGLAILLLILQRIAARRGLGVRFTRPAWLAVPVWLLMLAFALGGARYQVSLPAWTPGFIGWYNDSPQELVVNGFVAAPAEVRDEFIRLQIHTTGLQQPGATIIQPVSGLLLVTIRDPGVWAYGDRLRLTGSLETPPEFETFSYQDYLARQGIYSQMRSPEVLLVGTGAGNPFLAWIYALRTRALHVVYALWPDPEASLLAGILLGVETGIPRDVQEAFAATGTSHIIVISGFNITIVAGLFSAGLGRLLGPRRGALAGRNL